jgi:formylglycine-generating enzyme
MTEPADGDQPSEIIAEFVNQLEAGENPDVEAYAARDPERAEKLRTLAAFYHGMRAEAPAGRRCETPANEDAPPPAERPAIRRVAAPPARAPRVAAPVRSSVADSSATPDRRLRYLVGPAVAALIAAIVAWYAIPYGSSPSPGPLAKPKPDHIDLSGTPLVRIPAGRFEMGSTDFEIRSLVLAPGNEKRTAEFQSELPRRSVDITHPFLLGMREVTVGEFREFVKAKRYVTQAELQENGLGWNQAFGVGEEGPQYTWENPGWAQSDDHPVVLVAWIDAVEFCRWKTEREQVAYRLPTEAEWEYVRRDGTAPVFNSKTFSKYANVADMALTTKYPDRLTVEPINDDHVFTAPVASLVHNAYGLYDLTGNVYEWCADRYAPNYRGAAPVDPVGPAEGSLRVARGGSWNRAGAELRVTSRAGAADPSSGNYETGFRVVRELP